ncbi:MAG: HAD family hydrolase [Alphaproteobacteria bacterium]|nr:HAD family hydrolase [Alphaproteobacteria bacterium]
MQLYSSVDTSSGEPEKMRLTLGLTGLLPAFDGCLFSAVQVAHGKPAPDLFLLAAQQMAAAPQDCVVIEDSVAGVQAAIAAGMAVFGYAPPAGPNRAQLDRLVTAGAKPLPDMLLLPALLAP